MCDKHHSPVQIAQQHILVLSDTEKKEKITPDSTDSINDYESSSLKTASWTKPEILYEPSQDGASSANLYTFPPNLQP